ncbi:MAG: DUF86 domain-containing protein [Cyanobacteriota bacterium]|jgi:uncharacterized protein with HEPN domain
MMKKHSPQYYINLSLLGEAVNRLSETFKAQYPQVPFNEMRGLRNRVVHEYKRVDSDIIWETIQSDITLVLNIIDFLTGE